MNVVDVPLSFAGTPNISWSADLIGADGSTCFALLDNDSPKHFCASINESVLPEGDEFRAMLVENQPLFSRLLLSDSSRYLWLADLPESRVYDSQKKQQFPRSTVAHHRTPIVHHKPRCICRRTALLSIQEAAEASRTVSGIMSDLVIPVSYSEKTAMTGDCSETVLLVENQYFQSRDKSWFARWSSTANDLVHILDSFETLGLSGAEVRKLRSMDHEESGEFYNVTRLPFVSPLNFYAWPDAMKDELEFQEIRSGSGRLSLSVSKDRQLLDQLVDVGSSYFPLCNPWSCPLNILKDKAALVETRRAENFTLQWIADNVKRDVMAKTFSSYDMHYWTTSTISYFREITSVDDQESRRCFN